MEGKCMRPIATLGGLRSGRQGAMIEWPTKVGTPDIIAKVCDNGDRWSVVALSWRMLFVLSRILFLSADPQGREAQHPLAERTTSDSYGILWSSEPAVSVSLGGKMP